MGRKLSHRYAIAPTVAEVRLVWSGKASSDLLRLSEFLMPASPLAASRAIVEIIKAPERLLAAPRAGAIVEKSARRQVRRILVKAYEIRYEVVGDEITVLRVFHEREDR